MHDCCSPFATLVQPRAVYVNYLESCTKGWERAGCVTYKHEDFDSVPQHLQKSRVQPPVSVTAALGDWARRPRQRTGPLEALEASGSARTLFPKSVMESD